MAEAVETPPELAGSAFESTVRSKAAELKSELIRQTLEDTESWWEAVQLQYRREHGVPEDFPILPTSEEYEAYKDRIRNEYYEWVEPAFERRLLPDPDATNDMIAALRTIESSFQGSQDDASGFAAADPALGRIDAALLDMGNWRGDLSVNFIDSFLTPLKTVSLNQAALAKLVREQLECNKILYIRYRKSVLELLDTAIDAVRVLNNQRDPGPMLWGTLVAISVGTVATALATVATGGLATALTISGTVMIVGGTLSQGLIPDPPKEYDLAAPTAQEVAVNVANALGKLSSDVTDEEQKVEEALRTIGSYVASQRSAVTSTGTSGEITIAAPRINTALPEEILDGSLRPNR